MPLERALKAPLTTERFAISLRSLGRARFALGELRNDLEGAVILPIGEINRLRRELIFQTEAARNITRPDRETAWKEMLRCLEERGRGLCVRRNGTANHRLAVLCRTPEQVSAALDCGVGDLYVDYEDIRRYRDAVALVRERGTPAQIFLATPRIQKAGEQGFFKLIENAQPDGVLIRNLGAIGYFKSGANAGAKELRLIGDFSLNVANPLTAQHFLQKGLERVTLSYDLNHEQVLDLLKAAPSEAYELTLHQHMPMFHMEHCVFAAFLSKGSSFLDCGRPCDQHRVRLRDRVGMEHPLRADVGCRNTLFNAVPQTGARYFSALQAAGLRHYRVELLEESAEEAQRVIQAYQALLDGERDGEELWRDLKARSQLGVTRGTLG